MTATLPGPAPTPNSISTSALRGRPPVLDAAAVLAAAEAIEPVGFSMTALARSLGVTPAALYHYFSNGDAVAEALAAALLDRIVLPSPDLSCQTWLREYAFVIYAEIRQSPWARHLIGGAAPILAGLRHVESAIAALTPGGVSPADALTAFRLVQRLAIMAAVHAAVTPAQRAAVIEHLGSRGAEQLPHITAAAVASGDVKFDDDFERQLDCALAGIDLLFQSTTEGSLP
ncbi:MAG: AcrR family transcriptional regulator [Candidatus Aldehydirespiratoraceae bacterium]|jgi:AcrR family transcriptional regulator